MTLAEGSRVCGVPGEQAGPTGHEAHLDPPSVYLQGVSAVNGSTSEPDLTWDEIVNLLDELGLLAPTPTVEVAQVEPVVAVPVADAQDLADLVVPSDELVSAADIKRRPGWTEAGIRKFLGSPDEFQPNPHRARGAPMRMYRLPRVEVAESQPEFVIWMAGAEERSASARRSSERAREAALRLATEWVPVLPDDHELVALALDDHHNRQMCTTDADDYILGDPGDDPAVVQEAIMTFVWRRSGAERIVESVPPQHRPALRAAMRDRLRRIVGGGAACNP